MLLALEKCCLECVYMKRRKNMAAEVLNLYLSAFLDFFGDIFSAKPSQLLPQWDYLVREWWVRRKESPDLNIEEFHHLMADWGRGRRKIRDCCMSEAKGTWCFWETTRPAVSKSTESSRKVRIAKYGFNNMKVKIDLSKNCLYGVMGTKGRSLSVWRV